LEKQNKRARVVDSPESSVNPADLSKHDRPVEQASEKETVNQKVSTAQCAGR
jgi:hypothetical protein